MALLYENTQVGYLIIGVIAGCFLGVFVPMMVLLPDHGGWGLWGGVVVLVGSGVLFHSLTVRVDEKRLIWYFGPRFWQNELALEDIVRVERVRNSPLMGWGIRWWGEGWLYNVSGLDAVEIETIDGTVLRIGTDEPERLIDALTHATAPRPHAS